MVCQRELFCNRGREAVFAFIVLSSSTRLSVLDISSVRKLLVQSNKTGASPNQTLLPMFSFLVLTVGPVHDH